MYKHRSYRVLPFRLPTRALHVNIDASARRAAKWDYNTTLYVRDVRARANWVGKG